MEGNFADSSEKSKGSQFDFDAAVAAARRDYPKETRDITFIDISRPGASEVAENRLKAMHKGLVLSFIRPVADTYRNNGKAFYDAESGKGLLLLDSRINFKVFDSQAKEAAFFFNHELGHLIVRNGLSTIMRTTVLTPRAEWSEDNYDPEMAADCFAVLRSLAQGIVTIEDIRHLSFMRAKEEHHETSRAIDLMLTGMKDTDFTALSLNDIKEKAAFYAEKCRAIPGESDAIFIATSKEVDIITRESMIGEEWLENMIRVCDKAVDNSYTFYATAKKLSLVFATGAGPHIEEGSIDITDPKWDVAKDMIATRARKIGAPYLVYKQS